MSLVLTILSGHRAGERLAVTSELFRLGRGPSNDLAFPQFDHVSTHHAELRLEAGRWFFEDLGSTNGSAVRRAHEAGFEDLRDLHRPAVELGDGDELHLGDPAAPLRLAVSTDPAVFDAVLTEDRLSFRDDKATVRAAPRTAQAVESPPNLNATAVPPPQAVAAPRRGSDSHLRPSAQAPLLRADGSLVPLDEALRVFEHLQVHEALRQSDGDLMAAAAKLGIGPVELQQRLDRLRR